MNAEQPGRASEEAIDRKVYESPVLIEYGSVAKLTQSHHLSSISDHGSNSMSPMLP